MKTVPQWQLRNDITRVLREVEAGERLRVTVDGRPVADLVPFVPIQGFRKTFVPRDAVAALLQRAPLDAAFGRDIKAVTSATIDAR